MFGFFNMMHNYESRVVGRYEDENADIVISTCSVSDGEKLYETGVSHPLYNDGDWVIVDAYDDKDEAATGHDRWVEIMTSHKLPDYLEESGNGSFGFVTRGMLYPRKEKPALTGGTPF